MQPFTSVTVIVNVNDPGVVGVPVSMPVVDKVNPFGNEPAVTAKEYPAVPPDAKDRDSPNKPLIIALGVGFGLVVGMIVAAVRQRRRPRR